MPSETGRLLPAQTRQREATACPAVAGTGLWVPDWRLPPGVRALMSTRHAGGASGAPCDDFNLAWPSPSVPDEARAVRANREHFARALGARPVFLHQVHGRAVVDLGDGVAPSQAHVPEADAAISARPGLACAVLVADCAPVLLCSDDGRVVGAAHAGWRGLAQGVVEAAVARLCERAACSPASVSAWIGPCIGRTQFEVGADVHAAFDSLASAQRARAFTACTRRDGSAGWKADLPMLVSLRLAMAGVARVCGGSWCTVSDPSRFFSFRRDGRCGRMAAAIAPLDPGP